MKNIMAMSAIFRRCWIVGVFLAMLGLSACGGDPKVDKVLSSAEAMMDEHPDSVVSLLEPLGLRSMSGEEDRARYALLLTQARHKSYIDETDDSLINIAVRYYKEHSSRACFMKACFYKATILHNKHDYRMATLVAMDARQQAQELGDDYWTAKADELLSFVFSDTYNAHEAIKYSSEAAMLYNKVGKIKNHRYALCDLAIDYANIDSLQASQALLDSIIKEASVPPVDSDLVAYCLNTAVFAYTNDGKYLEAKRYINKLKGLPKYHKPDAKGYTCMVDVGIALGEQDSLVGIIDSARTLAKSNVEKATVNSMMANYYESKKQYRNAFLCMEEALEYQNLVVDEMLRQSVVMAQRDFYNIQADVAKKRTKRMALVSIIVFFIFICAIFGGTYFYRAKMKIKNRAIAKRASENLALAEKVQDRDAENKILSSALSEKDNDISRLQVEVASKQYDIERQTLLLASLKNKSESLKALVESLSKEQWKMVNTLCNDFFEKGDSEKARASIINDMEREIDKICNLKNIENIEKTVNDSMDGIVTKLRAQCPFLKPEDVSLIILLYAGFSPKAVCRFTGMKLKCFYNKRSRLIKRILASDALGKERFVEKMR